MEAFEDENPFESDSDRLTSATSSPDKVDLSEPPSPPANTSRQLSPTSPTLSRPFPSPGTNRQPQATFKSDFCCRSDRVLHSGDDVEILVCAWLFTSSFRTNRPGQDHGCPEDVRECYIAVYCLCYTDGGNILFHTVHDTILTMLRNRLPRLDTVIPNSSPYVSISSNCTLRSLSLQYRPSRQSVITRSSRPRPRKTRL